ncbi:restriction endonuclease subunit S [Enterococcus faecium]|uniref:restriction endonuclease subunit S n=1 Tax=Enterococcus faecium TaxID=1352 RepID=UPI00288CA5C0|nr:restriction endonuclease subunit S [Enterococcus faecium]MDT2343653.1 restriction endonuclease subunit S [Enterococcus faecium]
MSNDTQPEIRFPGFTDEWEQRKLGELATIVRGASPRPIQDPKWFDTESDVGWLRIADVTEQDGRIYYLEQHISKLGQEKTRVLVEPHLLLSIAATVGKPVVNYVKTGVHDGFLIFLNAIFDREFMFQWLEMFRPKWQKYGQPGSQVNLNSELVRNQEILIPNNEEQQKIGSFFKQLDNTIALHQRKLDLLKETKKGFLQKMFPKNGAKVPEIRFPGFTGDWEERKLGEVVVFLNGRAFKQQELLDSGKYRVLRVGNFNTNDRWYYSNLELEEDKYANKGDLLYLWATSFGPEMWNEERVIYHYHIWKLKFLSKELDKQYLYTWLLTDKEKIKESTNGTTMVHVTKGGIEQRTFQFPPDINEQQKIGAFFKQLDDTIALHQRKLDLLKETKKGFLQKMFV